MKKQKTLLSLIVGIFILCQFLFLACNKDADKLNSEDREQNKNTIEKAFACKRGIVMKGYYQGEPIEYEKIDSLNIFQGDMIIPDNQITSLSERAVADRSQLWPSRTVYWYIKEDDFWMTTKLSYVIGAIDHWKNNTRIQFIQVNNRELTAENYIVFTSTQSGCSSYVGMVGGPQFINVGNECSEGSIIHEIGHAVGLLHEHSSPDRDNYLTVNYDNIKDEYRHNFTIYETSDTKYNTLDFQSIMMYGSYAFSKNGWPTILKKDGSLITSQRKFLSNSDKNFIADLYGY